MFRLIFLLLIFVLFQLFLPSSFWGGLACVGQVSDAITGRQRDETHQLVFQDLLQMQYENVVSMKLFGIANVNVNLLIFLINKKFLNK